MHSVPSVTSVNGAKHVTEITFWLVHIRDDGKWERGSTLYRPLPWSVHVTGTPPHPTHAAARKLHTSRRIPLPARITYPYALSLLLPRELIQALQAPLGPLRLTRTLTPHTVTNMVSVLRPQPPASQPRPHVTAQGRHSPPWSPWIDVMVQRNPQTSLHVIFFELRERDLVACS